MAVTVNVPTTAAQDDVLARAIAFHNDHNGTTFANINEMATVLVVGQLKGLADMLKDREAGLLELAYRNATPATKAQVRTLLGVG